MRYLALLFLLLLDYGPFFCYANDNKIRYFQTAKTRLSRKDESMKTSGSSAKQKQKTPERLKLEAELESIDIYMDVKSAKESIKFLSEKDEESAAKLVGPSKNKEETTKSLNRLCLVMGQLDLIKNPDKEAQADLARFAFESKDVKLVHDLMDRFGYKLTRDDVILAIKTKDPQILQFALSRADVINTDKSVNEAKSFLKDALQVLGRETSEAESWPMIAVLYSTIKNSEELVNYFKSQIPINFSEKKDQLFEFLKLVEQSRTFEEFEYKLFESAISGVPKSKVWTMNLDPSQKKLKLFLAVFYELHKGEENSKNVAIKLYQQTFEEPSDGPMPQPIVAIYKEVIDATSPKTRSQVLQKYYPTSDAALDGSTMLDRIGFIWKMLGQQPLQQKEVDDQPTLEQEEEPASTGPLRPDVLKHWEAAITKEAGPSSEDKPALTPEVEKYTDVEPLEREKLKEWEAKMEEADNSSRDESSSSSATMSGPEEPAVPIQELTVAPIPEKQVPEDEKHIPLMKPVKRARSDGGLELVYNRRRRIIEEPEITKPLEEGVKEASEKVAEEETQKESEELVEEARRQISEFIQSKQPPAPEVNDPAQTLEEAVNTTGDKIAKKETEFEKEEMIQEAKEQIEKAIREQRSAQMLKALREMSPDTFSKQDYDFFLQLESVSNDDIRKHFSSDLGMAQLAELSDNGPSSPCENLGSIFSAFSPGSIKVIKPECISMISPVSFSTLSYEQFEVMRIEAILADQASQLLPSIFAKLTIDQAKRFASQLDAMDSSCAACSGFVSDQLNAISSKEAFLALGDGINIITPAELHKCSARIISWLPSNYFRLLRSDAPLLELLFAKMVPEQFGYIPRYYEEAEESPFYGLEMNWSEIGGTEHQTVVPMLSIQAIELMNPSTLGSMPSGEFTLLNTEVKHNISEEAFSCIPAEAVPYDQIELLMKVNTKLVQNFTPEHMQDINHANIPPYCASLLRDDTWIYVVQNASSLNQDFLALESGDRIADLDFSQCGALKKEHWNQLGSQLIDGTHPCEAIKNEWLPDDFWKGINPACFASLSFVEELTETQLKLVSTAILAQLPEETIKRLPLEFRPSKNSLSYKKVTPSLLSKMSPSEKRNALKHISELPALTLSSLSKDASGSTRLPVNVLSGVTRDTVSQLSPEFLSGLNKQQLKALDPVAAGGLSIEQLDAIEYLSPNAFEFMEPSVLADMTSTQLNSIPLEALTSHLSRGQIASIDPEVLEKMTRFDEIGRSIDPLSPDHPCLGIDSRHMDMFSVEMARKYKEHCQPVLDSQKLQQQSEL